MKKAVGIALACIMVLAVVAAGTAQAAPDAGAATVLSAVLPGVGEWYNNDFKGAFPFGECIVGKICCLVNLSSLIDAANGNADTKVRIDFWSSPKK